MRRRDFLHAAGAASVGAAWPWRFLDARQTRTAAAAFKTQRTSARMLFPRPADGAELAISPVGLAWLPCPGSAGYRVEIRDQKDREVYRRDIGAGPVHLPNRVLPAGEYTWDVVALDAQGRDIARHGARSFTIARQAVELPWIEPAELLRRVPAEHPRVLYPHAELEQLRATLNSTRAKAWRACRSKADRALRKGPPEFPTYHREKDARVRRLEYLAYFRYFRGFVDGALMDLSLAYLFSEEKKYADAAKRILLEIASWPTADDDVTSVSARWGDEAGLSFSKCAHIAYDWLYPAFDDGEREIVAKMCRERAGQTYRRLKRHDYLTNPGESHEGRLIAYLTDMALALAGETPDAEVWLDYSLKALTTIYPHWAGVNGGWAEGTAYGLWYNTFYIPAFESLRKLTGYDLWQRPFFSQARYFFLYCTANHGEIRPFGDAAESGGPGVSGGSGYADLMSFHAHRFDDPHVGWWVRQIPGYSGRKSGFFALLHPDELPAQPPRDLPNARVFESVGWAGLHSDLSRPERDTCLIFKSSPYGSHSHSHADQNAFAIMKGGAALAIPSGYYGPSYGSPHHARWTRSTQANNCVLVDGQGQIMRSPIGGSIAAFEEAPGHAYVAGDATPAYGGKLTRCVRRILFLRPGLFLLLDEIEAPRAARFQWLLHAFDEMVLRGSRVTSRRRGAKLDVHLACRHRLEITQTDEFGTEYNEGTPAKYHREKPNHWHVTASTVEKAQRTRIAAVMVVDEAAERLEFTVREESGWLGAVAASKGAAKVEGWIRVDETARRPERLDGEDLEERANMWGRDRSGAIFVR